MKEAEIRQFTRDLVRRMDASGYEDLLQEVNVFERAALTSLRTAQARQQCRCALAAFRLSLAQSKGASIEDSLPLAHAVLTNTACDSFYVLQSVGAFAVYCEQRNNAQAGAALLQAALNRVVWDNVTVELKSEARETYERLLLRMLGAG